ncbi:MAG TPA: sel1 repeat family protein, partial [Epsilonproteobacteria bacterium]|nr:sel1 repeat family protein [Campylobacterota bacterium]
DDPKIHEILTELENENLARAQILITDYNETPVETIHKRNAQTATPQPTYTEKQQALIEEFDLFITDPEIEESEEEILMPSVNETLTQMQKKSSSEPEDEAFFRILPTEEESTDNFFADEVPATKTSEAPVVTVDEVPKPQDRKTIIPIQQTEKVRAERKLPSEKSPEENSLQLSRNNAKAMPHIKEKYARFYLEYTGNNVPPTTDVVASLMYHIKTGRYTDEEINQHTYQAIELSKEAEKEGEALQLIMLCATTESDFAQLILARELYRGSLLPQDLSKAFEMIHRLATEGFAEAMCDLGQLYEYGITVSCDYTKAKELYQAAADSGIKRADKHLYRVKKR